MLEGIARERQHTIPMISLAADIPPMNFLFQGLEGYSVQAETSGMFPSALQAPAAPAAPAAPSAPDGKEECQMEFVH